MGRPSIYSDEILARICERLSKGEPLAQICRDEDMPGAVTVWSWKEGKVEGVDGTKVSEAIGRAREAGFDQIAIDALNIADETAFDTKEGPDGRLTANSEWISRSKLRVETRLKLLAKWDPKRYGDRTLLGSDPENPLPASMQVTFRKAGDE